MTTTNISICNEALNLCGAKSIQSFDENTENAHVDVLCCMTLHANHYCACTHGHAQNVVLAPSTTHPTFGYKNAFPLPAISCASLTQILNVMSLKTATSYLIKIQFNWCTSMTMITKKHGIPYSLRLWRYIYAPKSFKPITGSQAESDSAYQN